MLLTDYANLRSSMAGRGSPQVLVVVAAPKEFDAVAEGIGVRAPIPSTRPPLWVPFEVKPGFWLVETGVGKANAGGATAAVLVAAMCGGKTFDRVLSLGIGGSLPSLQSLGSRGIPIGSVVVATGDTFADEGIRTDQGFLDLAWMGFPLTPEGCVVRPDALLSTKVREILAGLNAQEGMVATVSSCSGTDAAAAEIARRTGAIVEGMEGAAVLLAAARCGVAAAEVRVVSNFTGDRERQGWDLARSLQVLREVARTLGAENWEV